MDLGGDTCVFCDVNIEVSAHLFFFLIGVVWCHRVVRTGGWSLRGLPKSWCWEEGQVRFVVGLIFCCVVHLKI